MARTKRKPRVDDIPPDPDVGDPLDNEDLLEQLPDENAEEDYEGNRDFKFEYPSLLDDPDDFEEEDDEEEDEDEEDEKDEE